MRLVGWIAAQENDKPLLQDTFNVKGEMIYNGVHGCFEHCEIDLEAAERLQQGFPGFVPACFTAVDNGGNQLPRDEQPCWKMRPSRA